MNIIIWPTSAFKSAFKATHARWSHPSVGIKRPSRASNLASPATTLGLSWAFLYIFGVK